MGHCCDSTDRDADTVVNHGRSQRGASGAVHTYPAKVIYQPSHGCQFSITLLSEHRAGTVRVSENQHPHVNIVYQQAGGIGL